MSTVQEWLASLPQVAARNQMTASGDMGAVDSSLIPTDQASLLNMNYNFFGGRTGTQQLAELARQLGTTPEVLLANPNMELPAPRSASFMEDMGGALTVLGLPAL